MNIHEHQAKEIPNKFGIAVLRGGACVILSLSSSVSFFSAACLKNLQKERVYKGCYARQGKIWTLNSPCPDGTPISCSRVGGANVTKQKAATNRSIVYCATQKNKCMIFARSDYGEW